jgi:hypothetical protein
LYKKGLNLILPDDIESAKDDKISVAADVFFADTISDAYVRGKKVPYLLGYFVYLVKQQDRVPVFYLDKGSLRDMVRCFKAIQRFYFEDCFSSCSDNVSLPMILSSDARFLVYLNVNRDETLKIKLIFLAVEESYSGMPIKTISEMDYVSGIVFNSCWYQSAKIKETISYALDKGKEIYFDIGGGNKDFIYEAKRVASIANEIGTDVGIFCNDPQKVREVLAGI